MTKTKLTEIKETYIAKQRVRNNGESTVVEKTLTRYKQVNYVEGWARFGGFLLDLVFISVFELIIGVALAIIFVSIGSAADLDSEGFDLFTRLLTWLFIRPLFYIIFEAGFQGTPAKLILGRIVVDEYGDKPTLSQIIGRAYGRVVPFEAFSCFSGLGWHDSWSGTMVLRKDDLKGLKLAIQMEEIGKSEEKVATGMGS